MRGLRVSLVLMVLTLGTAVSPASASHSNGAGPPQDQVQGTGRIDFQGERDVFPTQMHINARSDPDGSDVRGQFVATLDATSVIGIGAVLRLRGDVTCISVSGDTAQVGGEFTSSNTSIVPEGSGFLALFEDNGEPGSVQANATTPDQARIDFLIGPPPTCPIELFPFPTPVLQGNYVVHDG
jgi:hypothetical protein